MISDTVSDNKNPYIKPHGNTNTSTLPWIQPTESKALVLVMIDDSTLRLSFLAASFFLIYLFASWCRRDTLVSFTSWRSSPPLLIDLDGFQLDAIPTVGFSNPILSYISALRFKLHATPMLKYGYEKVKCFCFGDIVVFPRKLTYYLLTLRVGQD
jgi:hypothetical protein